MRQVLHRLLFNLFCVLACSGAFAVEALPASDNPALEALMMRMTHCLTLQS